MSTATPRIDLDTCCLSRPFDDQTQQQIRSETSAIVRILARCARREWTWISSTHVEGKIGQTPDHIRRTRVQRIAVLAHEIVRVTDDTGARALELQPLGFSPADALHIACAEQGGADVLLSTDQSLILRANHYARELRVAVRNPLTFVAAMEGSDGARTNN